MKKDLSRQRIWQLKKIELGSCSICGKKGRMNKTLCQACAIKRREFNRTVYARKKRYVNCKSYKEKESICS